MIKTSPSPLNLRLLPSHATHIYSLCGIALRGSGIVTFRVRQPFLVVAPCGIHRKRLPKWMARSRQSLAVWVCLCLGLPRFRAGLIKGNPREREQNLLDMLPKHHQKRVVSTTSVSHYEVHGQSPRYQHADKQSNGALKRCERFVCCQLFRRVRSLGSCLNIHLTYVAASHNGLNRKEI